MNWKLEDAKNRFSEVVRRARSEGPQYVRKHGRESAVVLDIEEYRALIAQSEPLIDFLRDSPFADAVRRGELTLDRPRDLGRAAGRPLPTVDGPLLATADTHGLVLATRSTRDCAGRGARTIDPWIEAGNP